MVDKNLEDENSKLVAQLELTREESSFRTLRTSDCLYVDKTEQIYNCIRRGKYLFLARPRRFGKSLLCSTIEEIFSGNRELFKGLWIDSSKSDWSWEHYPIIKLDMTIASRRSETEQSVNDKLARKLRYIAQENYEVVLPDVTDACELLSALILALAKKFRKPVVVIIDEYDKPLLEVIHNKEAFEGIQALLKSFYEVLKAEAASLRLVFVTGVFKFSKVSMFSGANNFTDLTFDPKAATIVGYTQQELERYFSPGIKALGKKLCKDDAAIKELLKERYNGYCFGYDDANGSLSESVYNSFGMNHVFARTGLPAKWFESGSPTILIKKLHAESCRALLGQQLTTSASSLSSPSVPERLDPLPLLYFGGYLTIQAYNPDTNKLTFAWPNTEVSRAFAEQLLLELIPAETNMIIDIAVDIAHDLHMQKFDRLKKLFNQALACIGYKLLLSREDLYQLAFFMILSVGRLKARVEEVTQDGRIDIVVEMYKLIYIIELKIDESPERAIQQIKDKDYARKYKAAGTAIWAIGINLAGKSKDEDKPKNEVNDLAVEILQKND